MNAPARKIPVAVLGATGAVGQAFVRLLAAHPWFELAELAASERSSGKPYGAAARWLAGELPANAARLEVLACDPAVVRAPLVFSALDAAIAGEVEAAFARAGRVVLSNARNFRMEPDVPLLIPEINPDHLGLLDAQRRQRKWSGAIITNPNCAASVVAMALAPLHRAFGVTQCFVTTLQAVSGAGYPGVPSLDILGNVIPFIGGGEEEKIESETPKMLGSFASGAVDRGADRHERAGHARAGRARPHDRARGEARQARVRRTKRSPRSSSGRAKCIRSACRVRRRDRSWSRATMRAPSTSTM